MKLIVLDGEYAVCRLPPEVELSGSAVRAEFFSLTRTADELSVVCPAGGVPPGARAERGWRILAVQGPLDFAETGVLAGLAAPLARAGVSIFVVSTFDTDYLMVREGALATAVEVLGKSGHEIATLGFGDTTRDSL